MEQRNATNNTHTHIASALSRRWNYSATIPCLGSTLCLFM